MAYIRRGEAQEGRLGKETPDPAARILELARLPCRDKFFNPPCPLLPKTASPPKLRRVGQAISGPKNEDKTQGEVGGALKGLGFTSDMVYKF